MIFSKATLREPWALFFGALVVVSFLLVTWLNLWEPLVRWTRLLRIHIHVGGDVSVAIPLFFVWLLTVSFLDRGMYVMCWRAWYSTILPSRVPRVLFNMSNPATFSSLAKSDGS